MQASALIWLKSGPLSFHKMIYHSVSANHYLIPRYPAKSVVK
jgi:hypothetical protein